MQSSSSVADQAERLCLIILFLKTEQLERCIRSNDIR